MADEEKVAASDALVAAAAVPALDMDALGKVIGEQVQKGMATVLAQPRQVEELVVPAPEEDAFESVVNPVIDKRVGKAIAQSQFAAQAAADRADFYTISDADELAERMEHKDEVEKRFTVLARSGHAMPREDILKHLRGEKLDEFAAKRATRRKVREDAARDLTDVDGALRPRGGQSQDFTVERAYTLASEDKLSKVLEDKMF